jgi:hypothetical protein
VRNSFFSYHLEEDEKRERKWEMGHFGLSASTIPKLRYKL